MKPISIIITHWAMNDFRSETLRTCLTSIIETTKHLPVEVIVVDNGNNVEDSLYLLGLCHNKKISHYLRSSENLYFGWGRNVGYDISCGEYLVFSDNDIEYKSGWLDKCLKIIEHFPNEKYLVTPLRTDREHRQEKYWGEWLEVDGESFLVNKKAGSNSWLMRRHDFEIIGRFRNHYIAGSRWTDRFVNLGYNVITMEKNPLAADLGFKKGYNIKHKAVINRVFLNGEILNINN